ncbi:MAG: hypothetical protein RL196_1394 [Actinomycetota bacterium]|jgi:hypothetical protein
MEFVFEFESQLIEWRGPAPFFFVPLPTELSDEIKALAKTLSYGWGVVPVRARIGEVDFTTSLIPRLGVFLLPVKNAVRVPTGIQLGHAVAAQLTLG